MAAGEDFEFRLSGTLRVVKAAGLSAADRKAAVRRAVEVAMGLQAESPTAGSGGQRVLDDFQQSLGALDTKSLPAALLRLRGAGQQDLAKRLQKRSKVRNGVAHPDPSLLEDLRRFVSG